MKNILISCFCLWIFSSHAQEKIMFTPSSSNAAIITKTQKEINEISMPSEGSIYLNADTKCFNYYIGGSWFELCGTCMPKAEKPVVTAIKYGLNTTIITLQNNIQEVFYIVNNVDTFTVKSNQIVWIHKKANIPLVMEIYTKNSCGYSVPLQHHIQNPIIFKSFTDKVIDTRNNASYDYVQIDSLYWLCSDVNTSFDKKNSNTINEINYQNYTAALNACPAGWRLPTKNEVEKFTALFIPVDTIFNKQLLASQLQIPYNGIVNPANKQVFGKGNNHYIWTSTTSSNNKNYFLNIGKGGFAVMDAEKNSMMNVRCVKDITP